MYIMEKVIMEIRSELSNGSTPEQLKPKYTALSSKPHFWNMITAKELDNEILAPLVVLLDGMDAGEFSEDDASIMFGEVLVNKFVKGKVPEP